MGKVRFSHFYFWLPLPHWPGFSEDNPLKHSPRISATIGAWSLTLCIIAVGNNFFSAQMKYGVDLIARSGPRLVV